MLLNSCINQNIRPQRMFGLYYIDFSPVRLGSVRSLTEILANTWYELIFLAIFYFFERLAYVNNSDSCTAMV